MNMSEPVEVEGATRGAEAVLRVLAERVRRLRSEKGWSRRELSHRSGLSVRYLARIEAGEGNISVVRLEALASALGVTGDRLVRPPAQPSRLIALVGLRGAGKSTVGPLLARRLRIPFLELDSLIVDACGLPLDQVFELHGESYHRKLERETLRRLIDSGERAVLAAAGGVVTDTTTWQLLREQATVIWVRARAEDHWARVVAQGDRRPMEGNPDAMIELRAILDRREPSYAQAGFHVDTSELSPVEAVRSIEMFLEERASSR